MSYPRFTPFHKFISFVRAGVCYMWCSHCQRDTCHKSTWAGWTCTEHEQAVQL